MDCCWPTELTTFLLCSCLLFVFHHLHPHHHHPLHHHHHHHHHHYLTPAPLASISRAPILCSEVSAANTTNRNLTLLHLSHLPSTTHSQVSKYIWNRCENSTQNNWYRQNKLYNLKDFSLLILSVDVSILNNGIFLEVSTKIFFSHPARIFVAIFTILQC